MTQSIKTLLKISLLLFPFVSTAQSYIQQGSKDYILLERLEIKSRVEGLNSSYIKPFNRKLVTAEVELIDSLQRNQNRVAAFVTDMDRYNITKFLMASKEFTKANSSFMSKNSKSNLLEVRKPNFFWVLNPALQYQQSFETFDKTSIYLASAGINSHGLIGKKLAFDVFVTGNKETTPFYVRRFAEKFRSVPGFGNFKTSDSAIQYFDVRASLKWTVAKFINIQAGYDRNFLGNGVRSLWMSDFSGSVPFVKINTKLWKINFENLYMKLYPQFGITNQSNEKKYLRVNTLSINATRWLNVGIFDAVVFGREKQFEMNYLQPFTFLRAMEQQSGSPDNALLGMNAKANLKHGIQVYGQVVMDEFLLKEVKANTGWWANKFGYQLGVKFIDVLKVKNLDLQIESNRVRPFTYTHFDSVSNYSNANMPMAHQLGANFQEFIGILRYQPMKKLFIQSKLMYYYQGLDSLGRNMGSNILRDYNTRDVNYGWHITSGDEARCWYMSTNASYEVKDNLFLDAGITIRNFKVETGYKQTTSIFNIGFRWNIAAKREFDF